MSLRWMVPSTRPASATTSGRAALAGDLVDGMLHLGGQLGAAVALQPGGDGVIGALAELPAVEVHAAHPGLGA